MEPLPPKKEEKVIYVGELNIWVVEYVHAWLKLKETVAPLAPDSKSYAYTVKSQGGVCAFYEELDAHRFMAKIRPLGWSGWVIHIPVRKPGSQVPDLVAPVED